MKPLNRVCIVGAGSIGSLFAGHLATVADVSILTRRIEHAERLNQEGLLVSGKSEFRAQVQAAAAANVLADVDLVIIASKTVHVQKCLMGLKGHFPNALIMLAQNGLGCEAMVPSYGDWPVLSSVTFMAGTRHSDTHVEYELDTPTWVGPWAGGHATFADAQRVEQLLLSAGLKAQAYEDVLPAQWSKLIFNAAINSIAAVTDVAICSRYTQREQPSDLGHLVHSMMEEGKNVAAACRVSLLQDPYEMLVQAVDQYAVEGGGGRVPSMLADVRAKRPTEIDWITGAIVKAANESGLAVPLHQTLYRLIKARENNW